jgi:hypothetical protein
MHAEYEALFPACSDSSEMGGSPYDEMIDFTKVSFGEVEFGAVSTTWWCRSSGEAIG